MKKENLDMDDKSVDEIVDEQVEKHYEEWCEAVSQDLYQIAVLHDREVDEKLITALREVKFPFNLGFINVEGYIDKSLDKNSDKSIEKDNDKSIEEEQRDVSNNKLLDAQSLFSLTLEALPKEMDQQALDLLAVDYADIYLNHGIHASPFESVWLDEDHLVQQEPMFKVREWYKGYGMSSEDWRLRSEDHIVLQLQFIGMLLDPESNFPVDVPLQKRLEDATQFMDEHLLLWLEDFSNLVAQRCGTDYYASVAILTHAYIEQLRDALADITEISRLTAEQVQEKLNRHQMVEEPITFMPGVAESW